MYRHFIAINTFEHQIECSCPDRAHARTLTILPGDIIEIMNDSKNRGEKGWYFLVTINKQFDFYLSLDDLEHYYINKQFLSMLDIELEYNYLQYKINQALDQEDEEAFLHYSSKLKDTKDLKSKLDQFLQHIPV